MNNEKHRITINGNPGCMVGLQCHYPNKPAARCALLCFIEERFDQSPEFSLAKEKIGEICIAPVAPCQYELKECGYTRDTKTRRW